MTDEDRMIFKSLINKREEIACNRLKDNQQYLEVCKQQSKTEDMVEELYRRFEKEERIFIRRHYEGETHKQSLEIDEVYLQGLRDSFKLIAFLGVFSDRDVSL